MKNRNFNQINIFLALFVLTIFSNLLLISPSKNTSINPLTSFPSFMQSNSATKFETKLSTSKKTRWTQDGRMCAHAFVQDGETFFDCTKSKSPDGLMNNKEWCYVESPQRGTKLWDYCKPIMDYDQVRKYNQKCQKELSKTVAKVNEGINNNIDPAQKTLTELSKLQSGQEDLFKRINEMSKSIEKINHAVDKINKTKNSWVMQTNSIKELKFLIEKMKERQKENDDKEAESSIQGDDISDKINARDIILETKKVRTKNCKGLMNYEDEDEGDGLVGKYFNNEVWIGRYTEKKDPTINFNWTGSSPMKEINPNNFSIKWEGFLFVPHTDTYNFITKADDGVELTVNGQIILRSKMNTGLDIEESTRDIGEAFPTDPNKIKSEIIRLQGGVKVKIIFKYFHSIHNDLDEEGQVMLKLYWRSSEFDENIIPKKYLYSSNDFPPLKVTGFNSKTGILRKLYENDLAFKNSDLFIIQDIPPEYNGATCLKLDTRFNEKELIFHLNTPSIVYIAFLSHYPNPLPEEFENTGRVMSLLQIDKSNKANTKKIVAKYSATLEIYKNRYGMGLVTIKLNNIGINKYGVPLILFFGFDPKANVPLECLGKTEEISNSQSASFKECKASSEKVGMKCEDGFSGVMRDEEGGIWSTRNEGVGAWISVKFKKLFEIRSFIYKNKKNPAERNKQLKLTFANGRTQMINLKNTDDKIEFPIEPIKTNKIKISIVEVYGTINNGGAFAFKGVPCIEIGSTTSSFNLLPDLPEFEALKGEIKANEFSPLFETEESKPINLLCRESISNSHKFDNIDTNPGSKIKVFCSESCASSDARVYGGKNYLYTKDSAICKAAFHSKKIDSKGGFFIMQIKERIQNYIGSEGNGIITDGKKYSEISIAFEEYVKEDQISLKEGTLVDMNLTGSEFKKGIITGIHVQKKSVSIQVEGQPLITLQYPHSSIKPCGTHFKDRDCRGSLKHYISKIPIKIRFIPDNYLTTGDYLPDYGDIYGKTGRPYGFSRSMVKKVISRGSANKPELETFVEFPPSPLSKYCNKPNPEDNCESVVWSVLVGHGKFKVKLFIGDPTIDLTVDFSINGKCVAKSLKVPKNKLEIKEETIDSKGGFISITSECTENCDLALSKLNAIEIQPDDKIDEESKDYLNDSTIKLQCGESFEKGRCDNGSDVLHCLFDDKTKYSATYCSGLNALLTIPNDYKCRDQIGKYKCVKIHYESEEECTKFCPKKCNSFKCIY